MANQRAPVSIVDAVLPAADLAVLNVTIRNLSVQTNSRRHSALASDMVSYTTSYNVLTVTYLCRCSHTQGAVTVDSFFAGSQLKLLQLLDCIYWWSHEQVHVLSQEWDTRQWYSGATLFATFAVSICWTILL